MRVDNKNVSTFERCLMVLLLIVNSIMIFLLGLSYLIARKCAAFFDIQVTLIQFSVCELLFILTVLYLYRRNPNLKYSDYIYIMRILTFIPWTIVHFVTITPPDNKNCAIFLIIESMFLLFIIASRIFETITYVLLKVIKARLQQQNNTEENFKLLE